MANKTIKLKKYLDIVGEKSADGVIIPGMLIAPTSADKVRAHNVAAGDVIPMFALEDELRGKGIDDSYADGDKVQYWIPQRGEEVLAILADGYDIDIGDFLASNGDGYLREHSVESSGDSINPLQIVAQALEAVDTSGSSGEESSQELSYARRIKVRIV